MARSTTTRGARRPDDGHRQHAGVSGETLSRVKAGRLRGSGALGLLNGRSWPHQAAQFVQPDPRFVLEPMLARIVSRRSSRSAESYGDHALTGTGTWLSAVELFPSCPLPLSPPALDSAAHHGAGVSLASGDSLYRARETLDLAASVRDRREQRSFDNFESATEGSSAKSRLASWTSSKSTVSSGMESLRSTICTN